MMLFNKIGDIVKATKGRYIGDGRDTSAPAGGWNEEYTYVMLSAGRDLVSFIACHY